MHDRGSDTTTRAKTMWSESLFEGLYLALKKGKKNDVIMGILRDIKAKQYKDHYIIRKTKRDLGPTEGARVAALLSGKPVPGPAARPAQSPGGQRQRSSGQRQRPLSKADQARTRAAKKRAEQGLFAGIKRFFGNILQK